MSGSLARGRPAAVPGLVFPPVSPYAAPLPGSGGSVAAMSGGWKTARTASSVSSARAHTASASEPASPQRSGILGGAKTVSTASLSKFSLASAAGNLSARGTAGLQWSVLHGRPVIGLDCAPEVGQRVVSVADSPFRSLGLGTIMDVDGCARGFAAVSWDREHGSARPAAEFCVGHKGIYLLELAQLEDIVSGQRYESINAGQGSPQARCIEDIFSEPFGGPRRKRRFPSRLQAATTSSQKDSLAITNTGKSFLRRGQGRKVSMANYQAAKVNKTLTEHFIRFAKGTKRKRNFGYNVDAVKVQTMQSMNMRELQQCLQYLDVRQDKAFLRGPTPILTMKGIQAQYDYYAPWSHPDAFGEMDFDRFALCMESVSALVGIPLTRLICVPPHDVRGNTIASGLERSRGIVLTKPKADDESDIDAQRSHRDDTGNSLEGAKRRPFAPPALKTAHQAIERQICLASPFYSDEDRRLEQQEIKEAAAHNLKDFLSWITHEQRLEREAHGSIKDWSHKFIVNNSTTAWYEGPQHKVFVKASSAEQMVYRLDLKLKKLLDIPVDNKLVIKYNITSRSELVRGKDPKWIHLNAQDLKLVPIHGGGPYSAGAMRVTYSTGCGHLADLTNPDGLVFQVHMSKF